MFIITILKFFASNIVSVNNFSLHLLYPRIKALHKFFFFLVLALLIFKSTYCMIELPNIQSDK